MRKDPLEISDGILLLISLGRTSGADFPQKRCLAVYSKVLLDFGLQVADNVDVVILHLVHEQVLKPGDVLVVRLDQLDEPDYLFLFLHPALEG